MESFGPKLQSPGGYIGSFASRGGWYRPTVSRWPTAPRYMRTIFLPPTALSSRRAVGAPVGIVLGAATGILVKLSDG